MRQTIRRALVVLHSLTCIELGSVMLERIAFWCVHGVYLLNRIMYISLSGVNYLVRENGLLVFHYAVHNMQYIQLLQELLSVLLFVMAARQQAGRRPLYFIAVVSILLLSFFFVA